MSDATSAGGCAAYDHDSDEDDSDSDVTNTYGGTDHDDFDAGGLLPTRSVDHTDGIERLVMVIWGHGGEIDRGAGNTSHHDTGQPMDKRRVKGRRQRGRTRTLGG